MFGSVETIVEMNKVFVQLCDKPFITSAVESLIYCNYYLPLEGSGRSQGYGF
jgi:hypothetical protein